MANKVDKRKMLIVRLIHNLQKWLSRANSTQKKALQKDIDFHQNLLNQS